MNIHGHTHAHTYTLRHLCIGWHFSPNSVACPEVPPLKVIKQLFEPQSVSKIQA